MRKKIKFNIAIVLILVAAMFANTQATAKEYTNKTAVEAENQNNESKEKISIVESNIKEKSLSIVLNSQDEIKEADSLVDGIECPVQEIYKVSEKSISTLILIDNSASIKEANRENIKEMVDTIIDQKKDNEKISIATVGEEINYLGDFTSDRYELLKAFETIEYKKQTTYLVSELSEAMEHLEGLNDDSVKRIVLVSDGYNNAEKGRTSTELLDSLEKRTYPIFTVGCVEKENKQDLNDNLHLFSRTTIGTTGVNIKNNTDIKEVMKYLNKIYAYTGITFVLDETLLDGMTKAIEVTVNTEAGDSKTISKANIQMPMIKKEVEKQQVTSKPEKIEQKKNENNTKVLQLILWSLLGIVLVIGLAIGFTIFIKKKKRKATFEEKIQDMDVILNRGKKATDGVVSIDRKESRNFISMDDELDRTVIIAPDNQMFENVFVNNNQPIWNVKLKDINNNRIFEKQIEKELVIGRVEQSNAEQTVVINYDVSISKAHCKLFFKDGSCYLEDLNSANHTMVNGNLVTEILPIVSGDILTLGNVTLELMLKVL